jgi:hypothetical protein
VRPEDLHLGAQPPGDPGEVDLSEEDVRARREHPAADRRAHEDALVVGGRPRAAVTASTEAPRTAIQPVFGPNATGRSSGGIAANAPAGPSSVSTAAPMASGPAPSRVPR